MRKNCRKRALRFILLPGVALAMIFTGFPAATVNAAPTSNNQRESFLLFLK